MILRLSAAAEAFTAPPQFGWIAGVASCLPACLSNPPTCVYPFLLVALSHSQVRITNSLSSPAPIKSVSSHYPYVVSLFSATQPDLFTSLPTVLPGQEEGVYPSDSDAKKRVKTRKSKPKLRASSKRKAREEGAALDQPSRSKSKRASRREKKVASNGVSEVPIAALKLPIDKIETIEALDSAHKEEKIENADNDSVVEAADDTVSQTNNGDEQKETETEMEKKEEEEVKEGKEEEEERIEDAEKEEKVEEEVDEEEHSQSKLKKSTDDATEVEEKQVDQSKNGVSKGDKGKNKVVSDEREPLNIPTATTYASAPTPKTRPLTPTHNTFVFNVVNMEENKKWSYSFDASTSLYLSLSTHTLFVDVNWIKPFANSPDASSCKAFIALEEEFLYIIRNTVYFIRYEVSSIVANGLIFTDG